MNHKCDGCRYKGQHQEMMFRPMGVCNRGANLLEAIKNYEAEKCPYRKTNGDRIRAMSDEELAKWIFGITIGDEPRSWCDFHCQKTGKYGCEKCALEWLKQPAENEKEAVE